MRIPKLEMIMINFDEQFLDSLLGEMKESLYEWNCDSLTKKNKVEIIIGIFGLKLFDIRDFRYNFILAIEDKELLKNILWKAFKEKLDNRSDLYTFAEKFRGLSFKEEEPYIYLIKDYFGLNNFQFTKYISETEFEERFRVGDKFFELYDYQYMIKQQVINDLSNPDKDLYKILIHMPTGTGKTNNTMHIIAYYINFLSKNKGMVVWIAHTNELLRQAYETFVNVWQHLALNEISIYKGWVNFPNDIVNKNGILFVSIQSLQEKLNKKIFDDIAESASLIIFDEVHKAGAKKTKECINKLMNKKNKYGKKLIGLTATPGRTTDNSNDNILFSESFDHIVEIDIDKINMITLTEQEARNYRGSKDPIGYFQEHKYLSIINKEVLDFKNNPFIEEIKMQLRNKTEDLSEDLIKRIALNRMRNIKIVERLKQLDKNNIPTIVFACSLQHAMMLSAFLNLEGVKNSLVYGEMNSYERQSSISDFKEGRVNIIINFDILTTGFDSTNIKCVFITRPTKSVILYSQMIGRGLRGPKMGGNETILLIDVEENISIFNENKAFKHFEDYWRSRR